MTSADLLAGPAGSVAAIGLMAAVTYLCRVSGVLLMSRVRMTPAVERGLRALPGSIVVAIVLPVGVQAGPSALAGLAASVLAMRFVGHELAALVAGLSVVAALRALGF